MTPNAGDETQKAGSRTLTADNWGHSRICVVCGSLVAGRMMRVRHSLGARGTILRAVGIGNPHNDKCVVLGRHQVSAKDGKV